MGQRLGNASPLYLEAIRDGNYVKAINEYSGARYTQHSTPMRDGTDGFIEFFANRDAVAENTTAWRTRQVATFIQWPSQCLQRWGA